MCNYERTRQPFQTGLEKVYISGDKIVIVNKKTQLRSS